MSDVAIIKNVGGIVFDATFKEEHEDTSTVTDNPIETGVSVSDHMYANPRKVTISAGVTNSPMYTSGDDAFSSGSSSRIKAAFDTLKALKESRQPFDIQTGLLLYNNMVCLSIKFSQDVGSSNVFDFDAECREVIIVNTQLVTYPPRKPGATARQGTPTADKGEQQAAEPSAPKQSLLAKITGGL